MMLISVIVLVSLTYVPVAYSNNTGPTSWKPTEPQDKFVNSNIQNVYPSNGPVLQPVKDPAHIPISYPTISNDIRSQPSPIQFGHPKEPGFSYQIRQNVPGTQNTVQQIPQGSGKESSLPLRAPTFHRITPNPNLKAIYAASKPTKRYTIIHLNGTVEHTDELNTIAARNPNYVLLKADDILGNKYNQPIHTAIPSKQSSTPITLPIPINVPPLFGQQSNAQNQNSDRTTKNNQEASLVSNPSTIYESIQNVKNQKLTIGAMQVPIKSPTSRFEQSISLTKQQYQINPVNADLGWNNDQSIIRNINGPVAPDVLKTITPKTLPPIPNDKSSPNDDHHFNGILQNPYNYTPNNQVTDQPVIKDLQENVIASNPSANYQPLPQDTQKIPFSVAYVPINVDSIPQDEHYSPPSLENSHENVVAANPLPIYPETSVDEASIKSGIPSESSAVGAAVAPPISEPVQQHVITLPNNDHDIILNPPIIKDAHEAVVALNSSPSIPYTDEQNQSFSIKVSTEPTLEIPSNIVQHQTLPIALPQVQPDNTSQETPIITEELQPVDVTPEKSTISEINSSYNIGSTETKSSDSNNKTTSSDSPKDTLNATNTNKQFIDISNMTIYDMNSPDATEELKTRPKIESVSEEPCTTSNSDKQWTWLSLTDKSLWENLQNNMQNVYFFFMPPQPEVTKETKTTIFPNGTTLEEITETIVRIGRDGEPKVIKTTTVIYN